MKKNVGVLTHEGADVSAPFFADLLTGMAEFARDVSLQVNPEFIDALDGVIALGPEGDDSRLKKARSQSLPILVVAGRIPGLPCFDVDNQNMADMATTHLLESGRRRVALINGKMDTSNGRDRAEGFRVALAKVGLVLSKGLQLEGRFSREGGRAAMESFLRLSLPPDAVFAANDHMALGAWEVLENRGVRVPEDVALVGIDDIPESEEKGLTSVQQPLREMGRRAAEQMGNWISGESRLRTVPRPAETVETFQGILIVRGSSRISS